MQRTHDPFTTASAIAQGHSFKHVVRGEFSKHKRCGEDTGVRTRDDFSRHIENTLLDKETQCFKTEHGHDIYYNKRTNTFISYDPKSPDLGTCIRPTSNGRYFNEQFDNNVRHGGSTDRDRVKTGGFLALYPERAKEIETQRQQAREPREPARTHPGRSILESVNARTSQQRSAFHDAAARSGKEKTTMQPSHRLPRSLVERIKARQGEKQNREKVKDRGDKER